MAKKKTAEQELAQLLKDWKRAFESLRQLMDQIVSRYRRGLPPDHVEDWWHYSNFWDLPKERRSHIGDMADFLERSYEDLSARATELRHFDSELEDRKILARLELAKLFNKADYVFSSEELLEYSDCLKDWACHEEWVWAYHSLGQECRDLRGERGLLEDRRNCTWSEMKSKPLLHRINTEISQLHRDMKDHPPFVLSKDQMNGGDKNQGGRPPEYSDEVLEQFNREYKTFRHEYKSDLRKPIGIRSGGLEHFLDWAERKKIDIEARDKDEANKMLDAYRKRFPTPAKRKTKTAQKKRNKKTTR